MTRPILEVRDLRAHLMLRRGAVKAVDGVSFDLHPGETLGIVGESGSGKTMMGLSLLRLLPRPAGRIVGGSVIFDGEDLLAKSEREMRAYRGSRISMLLQDPMTSLNPVFRIGNQVAEPLTIHQNLAGRGLRDKVRELLRLVRIPAPEARMSDYPHQMSGGMRQRVVGAIGLACQPQVLIADEPTTALDVTIQSQYLRLLKEIQQETGVAIIFITHDLGVVARMCHRVAVMYAGRIVEIAPVRDLFNNPQHPYTVALLRSLPKLEERAETLYAIGGQPPSLMNLPKGCAFTARCGLANARCREAYPPQIDIARGHMARCWRTEEKAHV
ncbi:ABC transporter ATP-binding protein [Paracoccus sp. CPCC 101403]|uniref:ABC transporter ATP-binding protein n=1 Tax=Paracoccus broussonetiae TaxID=3075834 RepID=A0ABU3EJ02_9RHOB|nr:ABC transporter ATP-binding protein [Paracoccus sp. CPCC 101403]MDT1064233.1 ABC transporter ATP-binding protein [Paracoccus sp. CPCC 101403]